jgi:hypothetical protein
MGPIPTSAKSVIFFISCSKENNLGCCAGVVLQDGAVVFLVFDHLLWRFVLPNKIMGNKEGRAMEAELEKQPMRPTRKVEKEMNLTVYLDVWQGKLKFLLMVQLEQLAQG